MATFDEGWVGRPIWTKTRRKTLVAQRSTTGTQEDSYELLGKLENLDLPLTEKNFMPEIYRGLSILNAFNLTLFCNHIEYL